MRGTTKIRNEALEIRAIFETVLSHTFKYHRKRLFKNLKKSVKATLQALMIDLDYGTTKYNFVVGKMTYSARMRLLKSVLKRPILHIGFHEYEKMKSGHYEGT